MESALQRCFRLWAGFIRERVRLSVVRWAQPNHIERATVVGVVSLHLGISTYPARVSRNRSMPQRQVQCFYGTNPFWLCLPVPYAACIASLPHFLTHVSLLYALTLKDQIALFGSTFHCCRPRTFFTPSGKSARSACVRVEIKKRLGDAAARTGLVGRIYIAHAGCPQTTFGWEVMSRACKPMTLRVLSQMHVYLSSSSVELVC